MRYKSTLYLSNLFLSFNTKHLIFIKCILFPVIVVYLCRNNSADSGALTPPFSACNWFVIIEFLGECFVTLRFTWALLLRIEKTIIHWDIGIYGKWWCVCRLVVGSQLHSSTSKIPLYNEIIDELSFSHEICSGVEYLTYSIFKEATIYCK